MKFTLGLELHRLQATVPKFTRTLAALAAVVGLSFMPGAAFAALTINSITPTSAYTPGSMTVAVEVGGSGGGGSNDWDSTNIALVNHASLADVPLYCGDDPDFTFGTNTETFNVTIPAGLTGAWDLRVQVFQENGQCDGTGDAPEDVDSTPLALAPFATPAGVALDLVLCIDGSGSLEQAGWDLQIAGTQAGLLAALSPADLASAKGRVTAIVFSGDSVVGPGPTIMDSAATLTGFNDALDLLVWPDSWTNTSSCMSAAFNILCGGTTCPDDSVRRVVDISTDGDPNQMDCDSGTAQECAVTRSGELAAAGIDAINVIGVLENVSGGSQSGFIANMLEWIYPDAHTHDLREPDPDPAPEAGDEGFLVIVPDFASYEPAIEAKMLAELACNPGSLCCDETGNFEPAETVCNSSTGVCDPEELCTGTSGLCPTDVFLPPETVCNSSTGVCDPEELCTGSTGACPADVFLPPDTVCNSSTGICDPEELCTGTSGECPQDAVIEDDICMPVPVPASNKWTESLLVLLFAAASIMYFRRRKSGVNIK